MKRYIILALVGLAACGGGSKPAAAPTTPAPVTAAPTTAAPTTTEPPTTVPPTTTTAPPPADPMETGRTIYAGITASYNPALSAIQAKYSNPPKASQVKAECAELAPLNEDFAKQVQSWTWPASVQPAATALANQAAAVAGYFYQCANATTTADATAGWNAANAADTSDKASAMRLALGMPIERS
jgi:hypothetical protein